MIQYGLLALLLGVSTAGADPLLSIPAGEARQGSAVALPLRNLAIRTPVVTDYVNLANQSVFRVSGTCRARQGLVHLTSPVAASTTCGLQGFSFTVNLTALRTSTVLFRAEQRVVENNQVFFHTSEVRIGRDVIPPSTPQLAADANRVDSITVRAHRLGLNCEAGARAEYQLDGGPLQTQPCGSTQELDLSALASGGSRTGIPFSMRTVDRAGNPSAWRSEPFSIQLGLQQESSGAFAIAEDGATVVLQRSLVGRLRLVCRGPDLVESAARVNATGRPLISKDGERRAFVTSSHLIALDAQCATVAQVPLSAEITALQYYYEAALGNDGSLWASQYGSSTSNSNPPYDSFGNEARFVRMSAEGAVINSQSYDPRNCNTRVRPGLFRRARFVTHPERSEAYLACDVLMYNGYAGMESARSIQRRTLSGAVVQDFSLIDVITLAVPDSVSFAHWMLSPSGHLFVLYDVIYARQTYRQARTFNGSVWSARTNFVVGSVYEGEYSTQFLGDSIVYGFTRTYGATQKHFVRLSAAQVSGGNAVFAQASDAGASSSWTLGYGFGSLSDGELVHGLGHGDQMTSSLRDLLRH